MFQRRRSVSDFSQELQAHLEHEVDRLRTEGLSEEEAWHTARRSLGNLTGAGERFYEADRWMWFDHLLLDTRHALRRLLHAPAFTITASLTLALGIGATTSIFTLVHAVLLKSLPVSRPEQLYRLGRGTHCCVWGGYSQEDEFSIVSYPLYLHLRDHTQGFEELAAFQAGGTMLGVRRAGDATAAETYYGEFVSGNYFAMFGVSAFAGRALTAQDDQPGSSPAAVMSYRVWQQKYALDPSIIGAQFQVNERSFTVIGITPPGFYGDTLRSRPPDFFLPLAMEPLVKRDSSFLRLNTAHWLDLIGRIGAGQNVTTVEAQMRVELHQWLQSHIGDMDANDRARLAQQNLYLSPGGAGITSMRESYQRWLEILMIASGFVLLIVCANVANLMLVRGMQRRQQISLSLALGARRSRLILPELTESIMLALFSGLAGLAIAFAGVRLILRLTFVTVMGPALTATPSMPVLLFAFGVSLLTGVAFGVAPAWMATRVDPLEALRGANRSARQAASLPRRTLVILQAALSLTLLVASGLLSATLRNLENRDFGFAPDDRTVVFIDPLLAGYEPARLDGLYRRLHDSLMSIPGVSAVGAAIYSPQSGDSWNNGVFVEGRPAPGPNDDNSTSWDRVTAGYFETVGNPMIKGRSINEHDVASSPHVAVVNEAFVRKFFPNQDPIGKHFGLSDIRRSGEYEIVGVAKDARYMTYNLQNAVRTLVFLPESQTTVFADPSFNLGELRSHFLHDLVIRTEPGVTLQEAQVRRALAAVDPNLPLNRMRTLRDQVSDSFRQPRLIARLTSLYGLLALLLASIGIYGVTAFNAGTRTNEIGVRMALGAARGDVLRLILRGALVQIGIGLVAGIPLTFGAGRFLESQLFGVRQYDPVTLAVAVSAITASAVAAAFIPAFRASAMPPIQALRAE